MTQRIAIWLSTLALASVALAADVTGKWTAQVPGRGGEARETTFVFKQEGAKLTGTMTGREQDLQIQDGKVEGDNISFSVMQAGGGGSAKVLFKGTVSGGAIKFTRQREGGEAREFTAKRPAS